MKIAALLIPSLISTGIIIGTSIHLQNDESKINETILVQINETSEKEETHRDLTIPFVVFGILLAVTVVSSGYFIWKHLKNKKNKEHHHDNEHHDEIPDFEHFDEI
ncbi:MAG: hypothetical protein ACRCXE_00085 [Metamycoplasmataceae bacterium]